MQKGDEGQCNKCKEFYKADSKRDGTSGLRNHLRCTHPELFAELLEEEEAKRAGKEKKQETRRGSGGEDGIVQCSAHEEENGERRAGRGGRAKRVQEKKGERRGGKGVVERGGRNKQVPVHSSSAHEDAAPVPAPSRPVGSSGGEPGLEQGTGTRHLAQLLALHGYDPSLLDHECFRKFLSSVNPEYNLPTRDAISSMCDRIVAEAQESLKSMLRKSPPPGRVTLAVGRAQTIRGEVIYTACHIIDDDWKLHRVLLDAYVVAPAIGYHDPLMGVNEVTPHMLPERVVADCLELGITPGNLYRMAGEMTDGFQSQLIDSIKQLLMENHGPNYGTTYYMGKALETNATYMDSVLHSTARCLVLDRAFTDEVFGDVQIYSMNRRKREGLLRLLRLDSPLEYGEQWYSWYCILTTMHRGGLNAVEGSKSFVGLVCKVWGAIYGAIRRISNPSCPASDLCPVLLQVSDALKAEIDNADVSHKFKGFQGDRNVVDILRDAKDTLDKAIQDEFLLWSIPLALDPRHKLTTPIFESVFGAKEAAENKIAEVKSKMHDLYTDYIQDSDASLELDRYLEDDAAPGTEVFDVMDWWREHGIRRYPTVAEMARNVLATPMCGRLPSEKMAHVSSIVRGYTQEKHIRSEEEEAVDNDAEQVYIYFNHAHHIKLHPIQFIYTSPHYLTLNYSAAGNSRGGGWRSRRGIYSFTSRTSNYTQFIYASQSLHYAGNSIYEGANCKAAWNAG
jgi:hypothetical protein